MESNDANAANSVKKFKSQSLNSLFRKSVSSASASPVSGSVDKSGSPKDPNASLSSSSTPKKAVTALSTATGAFKLAAMKRDKSSASPSASSNNSPRAENATVWKKQEKEEDTKHSVAASNAPASSSNAVPSQALNSLSPQSKPEQLPKESHDQKPSETAHSNEPRELDDEELVKKGINIAQRLSLSEAVNREFNWDDDDGDEEWQPSPELVRKAQEAMEASKPAPKPAPWSMATQERPTAVSIGDQIKELSEKKNQRHHAPPMQFQNVPHYNYRMPPPGQGSWNNEHDLERERYRYHDHEQRYRSNEPPRPELFNASSGQMELIDEQRFRSRRLSSNRSISPQSWRRGPSQEEREQRQREIEERQREVAEKLAKKREDEKRKEEEERQRQKDYMVQAREAARKRKEDELKREEERKAAARKKADEIAARIEERARKAKEAKAQKEQELKQARDEQIKRKQEDLAKQKQESVNQQLKKSPPTAPASHRAALERKKDAPLANHKGLRERSESIDETQALEAVGSVLDDDDKMWSGSSSAGSRSGGSGGSSSKLWSQPNRSQNDIGVWGSVQAVTNRFSSELGRKEDLFTSKDDLAVKNDQVWKTADWRPPSHKSQPVTPSSTSLNTSENRTSSRFFPSPKFENVVSWNGSPKMNRDSLAAQNKLPMNSAVSRTRSSPAQDDLSELPRVVLPPVDNASPTAVARPSQSRLPQPIRPAVGGPRDVSHTGRSTFNPSPVLPQLESTQIDVLLLADFETSKPHVSVPEIAIDQELHKFELFPEIPSEVRGKEQLVAHLSHYRDKRGQLHRREYEIDYGRPLHMWLIRLPGSPKRTLLTKDKNGKITVGEPPSRPQHHHAKRRP